MAEHVHHTIGHHIHEEETNTVLLAVIFMLLFVLFAFGIVANAMGWAIPWRETQREPAPIAPPVQIEGQVDYPMMQWQPETPLSGTEGYVTYQI